LINGFNNKGHKFAMKIKISILVAIAVLLVVQSIRLINSSGLGLTVEPMSLLQCDALTGPIGAEDITIDAYNKVAYIGADDRRAYLLDGEPIKENGAIWLLDLSKPDSHAIPLKITISGAFHPHGIALRKDSKGQALELYVVNHISATEHEIDIFDISAPGVLTLRRRVSYPEMISPNDLVIVAKDQFYVTNDHGYSHATVMQTLEDYLGLPMSSVTYFDGKKGHKVVDGLRMANGIELSADKKTLYVAETLRRSVSRYRRGATLLDWTYQDHVEFDFMVDNLAWSDSGKLLTAGHPKAFDFLAHVDDPVNKSASEVSRINVSGKVMQTETIYRNDGQELSGASVAVQLGETVLIGPVLDTHILRCQVKAQ
jgi:sugar lactone lactonase YvrE